MPRPPGSPRGYGGNYNHNRNGANGYGHDTRRYQNGGGNRRKQWKGKGHRNGYDQNNNNGGYQAADGNLSNRNRKSNSNSHGNNNTRDRGGWQQAMRHCLCNLLVSENATEEMGALTSLVVQAAVALEVAVRMHQCRGKPKEAIARELKIPRHACQKLHELTGYLMEGPWEAEANKDVDDDTVMADVDGGSYGPKGADGDNFNLLTMLGIIKGYLERP